MPVAAVGLETRSGEYSGFGTAQGARHIIGQRNSPEQRKAPAGKGGQRKAPGWRGGTAQGAR
eukprot:2348991-Pleurochrysis_carterae.AAC.3